MTPSGDGGIDFADDVQAALGDAPAWKILIADDDAGVRAVTRLALAGVTVAGRPLEFLEACTGQQVCRTLRDQDGVALVLMDLSMEAERSGLQAAAHIRQRLANRRVRIVLCTGEIEPMRDGTMQQLDLTDCWQKTDLTARRLAAIVKAAIDVYERLPRQPRADRNIPTGSFVCVAARG